MVLRYVSTVINRYPEVEENIAMVNVVTSSLSNITLGCSDSRYSSVMIIPARIMIVDINGKRLTRLNVIIGMDIEIRMVFIWEKG